MDDLDLDRFDRLVLRLAVERSRIVTGRSYADDPDADVMEAFAELDAYYAIEAALEQPEPVQLDETMRARAVLALRRLLPWIVRHEAQSAPQELRILERLRESTLMLTDLLAR